MSWLNLVPSGSRPSTIVEYLGIALLPFCEMIALGLTSIDFPKRLSWLSWAGGEDNYFFIVGHDWSSLLFIVCDVLSCTLAFATVKSVFDELLYKVGVSGERPDCGLGAAFVLVIGSPGGADFSRRAFKILSAGPDFT